MGEHFDSEFFAGNRARLRELFTGTAPIVITANGQLQLKADEPYRFRQDSSFWYLTGLDLSDAILVMDKAKEYLIVPERSVVRAVFDGDIDREFIAQRSGLSEVYNEKEGWKRLETRVKKVKHVATLAAAPSYIAAAGMYANPARAELAGRLKSVNKDAELLDLRPHLRRLRMVKQAPELRALQMAVDITIDTLKEVTRPRQLAKYQYEYEIEADITRGFRFRGALGNAFDTIVASGPRACTLHNLRADSKLSRDELLLMDVGAEVEHYGADITRTISQGRTSHRQEQVYQAVCNVQDYAYSLLKPGVVPLEYENQVEQFMGEKLRELGLIKTITHETVRTFFPHMTSHFLGLDTHDAGDYERPHEPGVVVVVEVGIYIPKEGIGVRIEDDVVITADGYKNLSARLPREL